MMIPWMMLPVVHAAGNRGHNLIPAVGRDNVDEFGYRLSFRLEDGLEIFSIRATFRVTYTYAQEIETVGEPFFRRHNMYALVGFYYGKTMLGRAVISDVLADYIAFYPKWHDSAGYPHDMLPIFPMFMLNDTIRDGQLIGTSILMDDESVASYISEFGGTFVFSGLTFVMTDGTKTPLSEEDVLVRVEKYSSELDPREAVLLNAGSVTYTSDTDYFTATLDGVAPWFVVFDAVLAVLLWGSFSTLTVLGILHIKGRIKLPLHKLRRINASRENSS
jgi:hypothetical protein